MKVSVGLPVYNGARSLARAIDSLLAQSLSDVEIVISDNASTDETGAIAESYAARDSRIRYVRQPENIGPLRNYDFVLGAATGELFMWLGHDDWLDANYLERCAAILDGDSSVALAAGEVRYYRKGVPAHPGRSIQARHASPVVRALSYLTRVTDNGIFYGLMRRSALDQVRFEGVLGGDWLLIASIALRGGLVTVADTHVHRDLGGTTRSYEQIARTLRLPAWNVRYPKLAIAAAAFKYFTDSPVVEELSPLAQRVLPAAAALAIASEPARRAALAPARALLRWTRPARRALSKRR